MKALSLSLLAGFSAPLSAAPLQGDPAVVGQWDGAWKYPELGPMNAESHAQEISHAVLVVAGSHAGKVLIWRTTTQHTADDLWLFDELAPTNLRTVSGPNASNPAPCDNQFNIFCSGHVTMADGKILIAGGTDPSAPGGIGGLASAFLFDPAALTWASAGCMSAPRWYPTVVRFGADFASAVGGWSDVPPSNCNPTNTTVHFDFEIFDPSIPGGPSWTGAPDAPYDVSCQNSCAGPFFLYPRVHLLSTGKLYTSGDPPCCLLIDPSTTPATYAYRNPTGALRSEACSFRLPGFQGGIDDIVILGGGPSYTPGTPALDTIQVNPDPESVTGSWDSVDSVSGSFLQLLHPRIYANAVILPDGSIFVVGGSERAYQGGLPWYAGIPEDPSNPPAQVVPGVFPKPVLEPELIFPLLGGGWGTIPMATHTFSRLYHSVAVLLPSGKVFVGGGEQPKWSALAVEDASLAGVTNSDAAVWKPPYLFKGPLPEIHGVPAGTIAYDPTGTQPFQVQYRLGDPGDPIDRVVILRPGSVTHHFDFEQRYRVLQSGPSATSPDTLDVIAPPDFHTAQRGYWMLFLVSTKGIPSEAKFVRFQ